MIFARYIGTGKNFTQGKVYPAKPEVDNSMADFGFLEVRDDAGENVRVNPRKEPVVTNGLVVLVDRYDFEFLEEVYAAVVKPIDDWPMKVGQVVIVDDADFFGDDKSWNRIVYSIKGIGFRSSDYLVLLDRTNVFPGMVVLDGKGNWVKVRVVDESLWIVTDNDPVSCSPELFTFAVDRDGDIQVEPFVECIDDSGLSGLTKGNWYRVLRVEYPEDDTRTVFVMVNDFGKESGYMASRFGR